MKIAVVTGSRADFGYLKGVIRGLAAEPAHRVQLVVTGSHLSDRHGDTVSEITNDGFTIARAVPIPLGDDSPHGVARAMAEAIVGFSTYFTEEQPDLLVVLGDRYEIFCAVQTALMHRIPVAHLGGGDVTEGAFDESLRHAISKMSHLHFVSHDAAARRLVAMGESPERVHNTGSTTIDALVAVHLMDREAFFRRIQFDERAVNLLVTFHPETLAETSPEVQIDALLGALRHFTPTAGILFTRPNADPGNQAINQRIDAFVSEYPGARVVSSLGHTLYANALRHFDLVVGNSSSGIYEAPTFRRPTVNIGDRQKGRVQAASVIQSECTEASIVEAIERAMVLDCSDVKNPYGDGTASQQIVARITRLEDPRRLVKKTFYVKETQP